MEIKGALIKLDSSSFAIVQVDQRIIEDAKLATSVIKSCSSLFPHYSIVLLSFLPSQQPILYGKKELVDLIMNINLNKIPWKKYSFIKK